MKKTAIIILAPLVVIVVCAGLWAAMLIAGIRDLDKGYATTTRGMTEAQVIELMGGSAAKSSDGAHAWWDDTQLGKDEDARIAKVLQYRVKTFNLPVTFEFTFDAAGKLVGRHIHD